MLDLPHHHCNSVYVPWISKGQRATLTIRNNMSTSLFLLCMVLQLDCRTVSTPLCNGALRSSWLDLSLDCWRDSSDHRQQHPIPHRPAAVSEPPIANRHAIEEVHGGLGCMSGARGPSSATALDTYDPDAIRFARVDVQWVVRVRSCPRSNRGKHSFSCCVGELTVQVYLRKLAVVIRVCRPAARLGRSSGIANDPVMQISS